MYLSFSPMPQQMPLTITNHADLVRSRVLVSLSRENGPFTLSGICEGLRGPSQSQKGYIFPPKRSLKMTPGLMALPNV